MLLLLRRSRAHGPPPASSRDDVGGQAASNGETPGSGGADSVSSGKPNSGEPSGQTGVGDIEFRYTKPATRLSGHMAGYDPTKAPKFTFSPRLIEAKKLIRAAAEKRNAESRK